VRDEQCTMKKPNMKCTSFVCACIPEVPSSILAAYSSDMPPCSALTIRGVPNPQAFGRICCRSQLTFLSLLPPIVRECSVESTDRDYLAEVYAGSRCACAGGRLGVIRRQKKPVPRAISRCTLKKRVEGAISPVDAEGGR
jgi:hypothetical protein